MGAKSSAFGPHSENLRYKSKKGEDNVQSKETHKGQMG